MSGEADGRAAEALSRLLGVMRQLRDPERGCPWDRAQTHRSLVPYLLEEAHEVADVIERDELDRLDDELGDLLFQVVFHARIAEEAGRFDMADVADAIADKLVRRHPHVFGDVPVASAEEQTRQWEAHKARERAARGVGEAELFADVPRALPALSRAAKLQRRAARVGLDWPDASGVLEKLDEELAELRAAMAGGVPERIEAEVGDLLFTCVNLARHLDLDPEQALRGASARFEARASAVVARARATGRDPAALDAGALDALWQAAKADEEGT